MTLERLLGDLTTASRGSATAELGACLASANLLIVDDVVSLADRPNTQSLLASLLTGVHAARRRLVIASTDSPAHLASTYRDILRRGRVVPIAAPDPDTGRALVAAHAERTGIALSDHQAAKLLAHGDNNPRCLQGLVHRVSALAALHGHSVTDEILTRALEWRR
jgi:chromosomal replication initiation ATPase DnaA